jgi:hypothetical protein
MGFLKRQLLPVAGLGVLLALADCMHNAPVAINESSISLEITAASTAVTPPGVLEITLANESGILRKETVNNPNSNGSIHFPGVPYGHLFIDINGINQNMRTLYGHSEAEVQSPNFSSNVIMLRNILTGKQIGDNMEQFFLQDANVRSQLWNTIPDLSFATCKSPATQALMRASFASSSIALFGLFEITDEVFSDEDRPINGYGEFTSDAVIVYLCKTPPHELNQKPIPAVRFQCEVGRTPVDNCKFNLFNFTNSEVRNNTLAELQTDEIRARILRTGINQRMLEIRINKGLLAIPGGVVSNNQMLGIVIRYRNSDGPAQPTQLCDWQSGQADLDPRNAFDAWGYLEIGL